MSSSSSLSEGCAGLSQGLVINAGLYNAPFYVLLLCLSRETSNFVILATSRFFHFSPPCFTDNGLLLFSYIVSTLLLSSSRLSGQPRNFWNSERLIPIDRFLASTLFSLSLLLFFLHTPLLAFSKMSTLSIGSDPQIRKERERRSWENELNKLIDQICREPRAQTHQRTMDEWRYRMHKIFGIGLTTENQYPLVLQNVDSVVDYRCLRCLLVKLHTDMQGTSQVRRYYVSRL